MADDSFILVSTKDDKSKKLAQVLTNESCRQILDYLGKKEDATESQIAKELNLPISTVHYNLKQLVDANFITADEYHYSEKGKEVNHYKLANKFIIIAPGKTFGWKQKLRSILPVLLFGAGISVMLKFAPTLLGMRLFGAASESMRASAPVFSGDRAAKSVAADEASGGQGVVEADTTNHAVPGDTIQPAVTGEESVSSTATQTDAVQGAVTQTGDDSVVAAANTNPPADPQSLLQAAPDDAVLSRAIPEHIPPEPIAHSFAFFSDIALWFFIGVLVTLTLVLVLDWYRHRK